MALFRYILLLFLISTPCYAQQVFTPCQLNAAGPLSGSECVYMQQGTKTVKATAQAIANLNSLSPNVTNATGILSTSNGGTSSSNAAQGLYNLQNAPISSPTLIANLNLWLNGDIGVFSDSGCTNSATNTGNVGCWADQSGNSHNYTASSNTPTYSTAILNAHNGLTFNGASSGLSGTLNITSNYYTLFIVSRQTTKQNFATRFSEYSGATAGYEAFSTDSSTPPRWGVNNVGNSSFVKGTLTDYVGTFSIVSYRSVGRATANQVVQVNARMDAPNIKQNGIQDTAGWLQNGTNQTGGNVLYNATPATTSYLGRDGSGDYLNGQIAEVIEYNRLLTSYETFQVEQYLSNKYGISIAERPSFDVDSFDSWTFSSSAVLGSGAAGTWDALKLTGPSVVKSGNTWYMAYVGRNVSDLNALGLASAPSPTGPWTKNANNPVVQKGSGWEAGWVSCDRLFHDPNPTSAVNAVGTKDYMFYCGSPTSGFEAGQAQLGVADCDLVAGSCTKYGGNPIIPAGAGGTWENGVLFRPFVYYNPANKIYYLYYNAAATNPGQEQIGLATATTPHGPWTKYAGNPIIQSSQYSDPIVYQPYANSPYWIMEVWFGNGSMIREWSKDLVVWNLNGQDNPTNNNTFNGAANGWERTIGVPTADRYSVLYDNGTWYNFADTDGAGGITGIIEGTMVHDPLQNAPTAQSQTTNFTNLGSSANVTNPSSAGDITTGLYSIQSYTGFFSIPTFLPAISVQGIEAMQWNTLGGGVDYLSVTPGKSGTPAKISIAGATSNQSLALLPNGTGGVSIGSTIIPPSSGALFNVGTYTAASDPVTAQSVVSGSRFNPPLEVHGTDSGDRRSVINITSSPSGVGSKNFELGTDFNSNGTNDFFIYDDVNTATRLYISSTGPIGIGTAIIRNNATLDVNGLINIGSSTLLSTSTALTNGAGVSSGTLTNAPAAGNPTKWVPINDNGTTRYIPAW